MRNLVKSHGSYPNDYDIFNHLIRITETQASEFLGLESGTWELHSKCFVLIPSNDGVVAIYDCDPQLWLLNVTNPKHSYELRNLLKCENRVDMVRPYLHKIKNGY